MMFAAMSLGAINFNLHVGMARASEELGIAWNTGEGGLHKDLYKYGKNTIVQVASGRFGVHRDYLNVITSYSIHYTKLYEPHTGSGRNMLSAAKRRQGRWATIPESSRN